MVRAKAFRLHGDNAEYCPSLVKLTRAYTAGEYKIEEISAQPGPCHLAFLLDLFGVGTFRKRAIATFLNTFKFSGAF